MLSKEIQEEAITFAQEVVRANSLSGHEDKVARVIEQKMRTLGYDQVEIDAFGNVIGKRFGKHPGPTILFDGHMDVVPVTNLDTWRSDPFAAEIYDGKIWGRGTSDMKGPLSAAVIALGHVPAEDIYGTLVVSGSIGEEMHEGAALEKVMAQVHPDFVVICEPNGCCLGIGQKGRAGIWVEVFGKPAHSSVPHLGDNAMYKAVRVIDCLHQMLLPSDPVLGNGVMELIDGISSPYPSLSTIPVSFRMRYDRRLMHTETMESVLESIRLTLADLPDWEADFQQIKIQTYTGKSLEAPDFHPGWLMDPNNTWIQKAYKGLQKAGITPTYTTALFCTNGSYSAGIAGVPTMIFGPSTGLLAHCVNENIEIADLLQGVEGYMGLATELGRA